MRKEFLNPGNKYRPIPFWSWNDKLEKEELEYQIEEMKKAGMGGYFMHARSGLKTTYLSEEWFDCIKAGIDKGKEVGLDAWAYDEEGWPSGFAGGLVPALSADYYAKFISLKVLEGSEAIDWSVTVAAFLICTETNRYKRINEGNVVKAGKNEEILQVVRNENPFYIDTLNKRAVDAFLETTHQEYYNRFGEDFGSTMKGFFTDEPRLTCDNFLDLAWSDDLPGEFLKRYGYDIIEKLPELYRETEDYKKIRYDFWRLVNDMFVTNYMKNIYDWCEEHNCKSTGHIMMEESIFSQMTSTGGVMPFYEYLHIPGIDWLRRNISSPVVPKQVGSVACQLGKKQILTESFALSGWDVSFEELKQIAEWQFVNGVNQICQHLQGYTIKGVRKRDYPPSLFTQQTWWNEYRSFNDYLGRVCVALSMGDQAADVLLIHPMRSGFVLYDGTRTDAIRQLDDSFTEANNALTGLHISYHLGDETIIGKYGKVEDRNFVVGRIPYKTVIMPQMEVIDSVTLELLLEFAAQGGNIFSIGGFPTYTNGSNESLKKLEDIVIRTNYDDIRGLMIEKGLVYISLSENGDEVSDVSFQLRNSDEGTVLFLANLSKGKSHNTVLRIYDKHVAVEKMIAENGEIVPFEYSFDGEDTVLTLFFAPMQSHILLLNEAEDESVKGEEEDIQIVEPAKDWIISAMDLNSFTLDMCEYKIDDGQWEGPCAVILLQNKLLELQRPCKIAMRFNFNVSADVSKLNEFYVVIEDASAYDITVNGKKIDNTVKGYWKDKSFHKVDIKTAVQNGENTILLETNFSQPQKVYDVLFGENVYETEINKITYDMEIESIYLLGDFGVISKSEFVSGERKALITDGPFEVVEKPVALNSKNFTEQGLLFFAGTIRLSQILNIEKQNHKKVILKLGRQKAPLINVFVNGEKVKAVFWAPFEADITDMVINGENKIELEVFASNRNLFGPHHHIKGECYNVGPESFTGRWSWVERESEADATEIFDMNKSFWTDTYCFVEFGLE